jgi:hypothetical protein
MANLKKRLKRLDGHFGLAALVIVIGVAIAQMTGVAGADPSRIVIHKGEIAPGAVTAKNLAKGAVNGAALAKGAVHAGDISPKAVTEKALKEGAVGTAALARDAVTAGQLAPGSVYGGALGAETLISKPIADLDTTAHNGEWTSSNTEAALCGPGEALLGSGFAFTNPGNSQASWLQALPVLNGDTRGVLGRVATDSGGTASGQVFAICLK